MIEAFVIPQKIVAALNNHALFDEWAAFRALVADNSGDCLTLEDDYFDVLYKIALTDGEEREFSWSNQICLLGPDDLRRIRPRVGSYGPPMFVIASMAGCEFERAQASFATVENNSDWFRMIVRSYHWPEITDEEIDGAIVYVHSVMRHFSKVARDEILIVWQWLCRD